AWTPGDTIAVGRAPAVIGEVVVAESTARARGLHVGDRILIVFQQATAEFLVSGLGAGEESAPVAFDLATAQALYDRTGRYDEIAVRAEPGLPATALRAQLAAAVGDRYEVVTSADASEQASRSWSGALRFLTPGLLVFSLVALLVSAFIIFNTFSILVGQRSREFGLARVLGASRAQVMLSVLLEAAAVGLAASVAGVALGVGAAHGLLALLRAVGFSLPSASVVFSLSTVVVGVAAGVLVTVLAAALPAHRATAVAPVTAVSAQDGDIGTSPRRRWATGLIVMGSGAGALLIGLHAGVRRPLLTVGLGATALLVGMARLAPLVARPVAQALGAPVSRLFGQPAFLGRENAMRNPRRTATTAAALMVGFGLIGLVCTLGASMRASAQQAIETEVRADLVVTPVGPFGVSPMVAERLRQTPGIGTISQLRAGQWGLNGRAENLLAVDPGTASAMYELAPDDAAALGRLDDGGVLVRDSVAAGRGWRTGDTVPMTFARTGTVGMRVQGTFSTVTVRPDYVISLGAFEANYTEQLDGRVGIKLPAATSVAAGKALAEDALRDMPGVEVLDRSEVLAGQREEINRFLVPMTALLGLSVVIGLLGIANTVALSVRERTGELGLLRALGMERRQLRSMIAFEVAIVAALGTALGLALSLFLSWALTSALRDFGVTEMTLPIGQLLRWAGAAVLAGVAAAVIPARRAARLDVLDAVRR
ncbi:MAG: ABC transporter permease, partial [Acidimicrobiales bacterium]